MKAWGEGQGARSRGQGAGSREQGAGGKNKYKVFQNVNLAKLFQLLFLIISK
jgi:hypothetical protein